MSFGKVISVEDAVALVKDGDVLATTGYGGNGTPDQLFVALEERFLDQSEPRDLTLMFAGGQGDGDSKGLNHLGHEGLLKCVIGGHFGLIPAIEKLALENRIAAYNLPEGVITHLYRDIAAGKPGTLSRVGLKTFVDPRLEGGKINGAALEDIVELISLAGHETLFFKARPIDVAFIRGTTADPDGNITMEKESLRLENLAMAMAARNSGGIVLCQVERIAERGSLDARRVRIPGILVDGIIIAEPEHHMQTYGTQYNPAMSGEVRIPLDSLPPLKLDEKKVIARRAALELSPNALVNLGIGLPDNIGRLASEEGVEDLINLTVDPGVIGGVPLGGLDFGASINFSASIDHPSQFDLIDGGGLDACFLGFAECDGLGNVNASRFANRISGCGGFINISQNSKKVIFVGTFTSGGLKTEIADGALSIVQEGKFGKFVETISQVTFSGQLASEEDREVYFVTERCVFRLGTNGMALTEVAPGIDVDRDILSKLPFEPLINDLQIMERALFLPERLDLRKRFLDININERLSYDPASNTVFMDYAGMRVQNESDLDAIKAAVNGLLEPVGRRVNAIINYERFEAAPEIMSQYLDLVRYVEEKYYDKVSRYTTSGFMRLKLGRELESRHISSEFHATATMARQHLREDG